MRFPVSGGRRMDTDTSLWTCSMECHSKTAAKPLIRSVRYLPRNAGNLRHNSVIKIDYDIVWSNSEWLTFSSKTSYIISEKNTDLQAVFNFSSEGIAKFATPNTIDMYYLLDTVPPIRVVCKNVATRVNIPPKMAASSVISIKVCLWTVCGCKYIANKLHRSKTN